MPPSIASVCRTILITLILLVGEVMPSCSRYIKKGLVYIIIAAPSSHQPFFYAKYIKANMCLSYNVCYISNAKYKRPITLYNLLVPYLICYRVLDLIYC